MAQNLPLKIGLLGLGTVGSGVVQILTQNRESITTKLGRELLITKALVRNPDLPRAVDCASFELTTSAKDIINDPDIDIIVEVMGGIEPARSYIIEALLAGKHVVTANKDLLALHGRELLQTATEAGKDLLFEASVAGGIPIISTLKQDLAGNHISHLAGIINGTTNYILTAMANQGRDYAEVLKEAQELGYAESDPSADVDGLDAARKLAILASIAFGSRVTVNDVYVEGISRLSKIDLAYAKELDATIKLLAIAREEDDRIEVRVHPAFLPNNHPLSAVNGVFNAIYVEGDAVGETMFYGRGAGSLPTGSAVVADLMQVAIKMETGANGRLNCTCYRQLEIKPVEEFHSAFYVRLQVKDEPRVLASLAHMFAEANISFASIIQKPRPNKEAELVLVTHPCNEGQLRQAVEYLKVYSKVLTISNIIRFEGGENNGLARSH
ncbi:MAG TPA: homoserine dehydrogenase [Desulfobacteria bacterium]|nr:homoserine dehydrogenase [Desulfobacteria bacterium]